MTIPLFCRHARLRLCALSVLSVLLLGLLSANLAHVVTAQEEPSPIQVELVVPQRAGAGQLIDVLIKYDAVDLNAGAVLNYNVFGPAQIWTRTPEPPNPIVNTWGPKFDPAQGSIKIQVQIGQGTEGQELRHEIEVKWGTKFAKFVATTEIQSAPTATPTRQPRPTATPPAATATPASPAQFAWSLVEAVFVVPGGGGALSGVAPGDEIGLQVRYTGDQDVAAVTVQIQFEPDVVDLDGAELTDSGYVVQLTGVPAAIGRSGQLFDLPLQGRIRMGAPGQEAYALQAVVQASVRADDIAVDVAQVETAPLQVEHVPVVAEMLTLQASVDTQTVRAGGNVIVHARCSNSGPVPVSDIRLTIAGLPNGSGVVPEEHLIEAVLAGETAERVFTIRTTDDVPESVTFHVAARLNEQTIESQPVSVQIARPVELDLQVLADKSEVRAGDAARFRVVVENSGDRVAEGVAVRLIDVTGNFGVLLQNVDRLASGETRELSFVIQVPEDFPANVISSMVAQALAADGTIVEAEPLSLDVVCVPDLELLVQAPADTLRAGDSAEVVVAVRNISQCLAREVVVGVGELPDSFTPPPEVRIAELAPGDARKVTFNLLVPDGQPQGSINMAVTASDSLGTQETVQADFLVGGVSALFTIVFALLVLLAVGAIVVGTVLYFRQR